MLEYIAFQLRSLNDREDFDAACLREAASQCDLWHHLSLLAGSHVTLISCRSTASIESSPSKEISRFGLMLVLALNLLLLSFLRPLTNNIKNTRVPNLDIFRVPHGNLVSQSR